MKQIQRTNSSLMV